MIEPRGLRCKDPAVYYGLTQSTFGAGIADCCLQGRA
jgi:hypothetical protein